MREPEKILAELTRLTPGGLLAAERERRKGLSSPDAVAMQEAHRMWADELAREKEAAKGGRPRKDGKSLKGTGVIRFRKGGSTKPKGGHGTQSEYKRGCRCAPCRAANTAAVRKSREKSRLSRPAEPGRAA